MALEVPFQFPTQPKTTESEVRLFGRDVSVTHGGSERGKLKTLWSLGRQEENNTVRKEGSRQYNGIGWELFVLHNSRLLQPLIRHERN